jgi:hypothetical protein
MFQGSRALVALTAVAAASLIGLAGCATPSPEAPTTATSAPSQSPTPEAERPAPAFSGTCSDLTADSTVLTVVGIDLPATTGADPSAPVTTYPAAARLAGGLLMCEWGAVDGTGPKVAINILPRFTTDDFDDYVAGSAAGCFSSAGLAACEQNLTVNGYWVAVSFTGIAGLDDPEARFAEFVDDVTESVESAPAPPSSDPAAPSSLAAPLCESGVATLSAAFGVAESEIVEPGHGSDSGIGPSALRRGAADGCPWGVTGFGAWEFWFLADGAWAFDEPLQPYAVDRGLSADFALNAVEVAGAESARVGCAGDLCEAQLVVGDDLLIVISRAFDGDFAAQVEKLIAAV